MGCKNIGIRKEELLAKAKMEIIGKDTSRDISYKGSKHNWTEKYFFLNPVGVIKWSVGYAKPTFFLSGKLIKIKITCSVSEIVSIEDDLVGKKNKNNMGIRETVNLKTLK